MTKIETWLKEAKPNSFRTSLHVLSDLLALGKYPDGWMILHQLFTSKVFSDPEFLDYRQVVLSPSDQQKLRDILNGTTV